MSITVSDVLAAIALLVSALAAWKTLQLNKSQERLNDLLLAKEQAESEQEKKADLGARLVKLGNSNYRLKIFNRGKAAARGVSIAFPDGDEFVIKSDVDRKFPLELLEPQQGVDLIAVQHLGSKAKNTVKLSWEDASSASNEKLVYITS